ncbi:hypothetical protein B0H14DRAFT_3865885 [Mycena olivaceomarginata]|nr:hypothetical protein B0H14DRAFT_3865885 [Mycena olivaceomarginata]
MPGVRNKDGISLGQELEITFNVEKFSMLKMKEQFRTIAQKHLDLSVTTANQTPRTMDNIKQELKTTFREFNDEDPGPRRLQLSMKYIKDYFKDKISKFRKNLKDEEDETTEDKRTQGERPGYEDADDDRFNINFGSGTPEPLCTPAPKNNALEGSMRQRNKEEHKGNRHTQPSGASPSTPSLLYLYPTFVEAEITDQKALDSLASWPRVNLVEFLGGLVGQDKLKKIIVEALVLRLRPDDYQ